MIYNTLADFCTQHIFIYFYFGPQYVLNQNVKFFFVVVLPTSYDGPLQFTVPKHIEQYQILHVEILNGKHTQHKCNGIVGESSCPDKEVNEGEDLPARGEYLCCD